MAERRDEIREHGENLLEIARRLRDEIRVNLHLASRDARDKWEELEPKVMQEAERIARDGSDATKAALAGIVQRLKDFREEKHP